MTKKDIPSTRPLIDKLGIMAGMRLGLVGGLPDDFLLLLREQGCECPPGKVRDGCDMIFLTLATRAELVKIEPLIAHIQKAGAIWVIYPKGVKVITESNVREAGLAAGLVDTKVVSFSATHTALKFVIPLAKR